MSPRSLTQRRDPDVPEPVGARRRLKGELKEQSGESGRGLVEVSREKRRRGGLVEDEGGEQSQRRGSMRDSGLLEGRAE